MYFGRPSLGNTIQIKFIAAFHSGKLGTSKINCGDKIHVCLHFQAGNSVLITGSMTASG